MISGSEIRALKGGREPFLDGSGSSRRVDEIAESFRSKQTWFPFAEERGWKRKMPSADVFMLVSVFPEHPPCDQALAP